MNAGINTAKKVIGAGTNAAKATGSAIKNNPAASAVAGGHAALGGGLLGAQAYDKANAKAPAAPTVGAQAGGLIDKGVAAAGPALDSAKNYFSGITEKPMDWMKNNPWGTAAIGTGAAGLLYWLLNRDDKDEPAAVGA